MNKFPAILFSLSLFVLLNSCSDEVKIAQRDFPIFVMDSVSEINYFGAKCTVTCLKQGKEPCTEYGVVWKMGTGAVMKMGTGELPTVSDSMLSIIGNLQRGITVLDIQNRLVSNKNYSLRAYARTINYIAYSLVVDIKTKTRPQPEITGYNKDTAYAGTNITVYGKNFSSVPSNNTVSIHDIVNGSQRSFMARVDAASETSLSVYIPNTLVSGKGRINVLGDSGWVYAQVFFYIKGQ